jgi:hypothetical protein
MKDKSLKNVVNEVVKRNPLNLQRKFAKVYYPQKIKMFLDHLVRGMNAKETWYDNLNIYECYPVIEVNNKLLYYGDSIILFRNKLFEKSYIILNFKASSKQIKIKFGIGV